MTGRDFIIYILKNNLDNADVCDIFFNSSAFLDIVEAAKKFNVGVATINMWVTGGYLKGYVVNGELRIPADAEVEVSKIYER